jgi:hypothetical protein
MVNFVNLADIYGAVDRGRANDIAMENARMQNQQNQRVFAQQDREIADKEKVRSIYRESGGDLKTVRDRLYGDGYASEAMGIDEQLGKQRKQNSDISKTDLENAGKKIDLMGRGMKFVLDNPTKQNALQAFGALRQTGVITEDEFNNYTAKLPDDPAMIKNGAEVLFRSALDAKEQLSKFETRDTGGKVMTQALDPVTGQVKTVSTLGKTQTPDSIASNARMAAEGAANRAVTMRGQNLVNERGIQANNIAQNKALNPPKTSLSASAQKELFEADEMVQASKNAIGMLQEAKKLNKTAYAGFGAKPRAIVASNLGMGDGGADDTVNLDNLMTGQALESLKATFGGMPTEGERKILLDIQASADKTPSQRASILDRAEKAAQRRIKFNESKAKALRGGTYFTQQPPTQETEEPARDVRSEADKILGL